MTPLIPRVTTITLLPKGEPLFCEEGFTVSIEDEAAGEFVQVKSHCDRTGDAAHNSITINPEEWPALRRAIDTMLREIDRHDLPPPPETKERSGC